MAYYVALIHKEPKSDYGVSFPDFPGCVTAGSTVQDAMEMAREALAGHIEVMIEDGLPIPVVANGSEDAWTIHFLPSPQ